MIILSTDNCIINRPLYMSDLYMYIINPSCMETTIHLFLNLNTMEKVTKLELPTTRRALPSVTYGFNSGVSHMYSNPVEKEAREDAKLLKATVDERMASIHRLIFGK